MDPQYGGIGPLSHDQDVKTPRLCKDLLKKRQTTHTKKNTNCIKHTASLFESSTVKTCGVFVMGGIDPLYAEAWGLISRGLRDQRLFGAFGWYINDYKRIGFLFRFLAVKPAF